DRDLGDFALGGTRVESLRTPMRLRGVGEVMRDDDHRSMVRCETAQRPEDFPVRFELEVHICKARMADLSEECDALTRILARCASLARRAQRCNGPSADAVRQ